MKMHTIEVERSVEASPLAMFELLSDPSTYSDFPGVKLAELVREGPEHPHGVGAVRRIHIAGFRYDEAIVAADPGRRLDYKVIASRPPLDHEIGTIRFESEGDGCRVTWRTTYRVPVPVLGPLLARVGGRRMRHAFDDAIRIAAEHAPTPGLRARAQPVNVGSCATGSGAHG